jgi:hypothetical protein
VFHMDVVKVNRDVAYVAMVVYVCCKLLFPMFHLFFRRLLQVCLSGCYICFTHMFTSVLSGYCVCFCNGFRCFCKCFRRMFQMFHLSSDLF